MLGFLLLSGLLLAFALALLLVPMLRGNPGSTLDAGAARRLRALETAREAGVIDADEYAAKRTLIESEPTPTSAQQPRRRTTIIAALLVALLMPASALLLYRLVGTPAALSPPVVTSTNNAAPGDHGIEMGEAIAQLAERLQQQPGDPDGWALLGRAYQTTQQFPEARDAFKRAHELRPDDAELTLAYAQSLALATPERRLDGEARKLIDSVLKTDPANQRGLWLLGISEYQSGDYPAAIAAWNRLLPQLEKGSELAQSVENQIADAQALADGKPLPERVQAPAAPSASTAADASAQASATDSGEVADTSSPDSPQLHVHVSLDPELASRTDAGDTVFIYARAAQGPPMPLAIQRTTVDKLPVDVTLDDSMGMMPSMKLSMFPQVVVGARVSKTGEAISQSGDLEALSAPLDVNTDTPVVLTIDKVVP